MQLLTAPITINELQKIALQRFGSMVKAVVDVDKELLVIDAELHADQEKFLLEHGSSQVSLWGINLYPSLEESGWIEFDSMINLRPSQNNLTRGVDKPIIQKKIEKIVAKYITR